MAAATAILLHRLTGADDVVIGLPVAARGEAARRIPGMASNVLPLRLALHPGMTVAEVLGQVSQRLRQALPHQRYQLADMRRDVGGQILFGLSINVMPFDYGFSFAGQPATAHNLSLGPVEDLSISVYDRSDASSAADRSRRQSGAAHGGRSGRLSAAISAAVDRPRRRRAPDRQSSSCWSAPSATPSCGNGTTRRAPTAQPLLPELFAAQAAAHAGRHGGHRAKTGPLTYRALDAQSNRLAHHLRSLGVGPETVVGLCVERSPEMLVGLLGILKAGGAYLPLDAGYPRERLAFMLADAGVAVLVTQSALVDRLPVRDRRTPIVRLDADAAAIARQPDRAPPLDPRPAPPGLCHLHLRLDRRAEGASSSSTGAWPTRCSRSAATSTSTSASAPRC